MPGVTITSVRFKNYKSLSAFSLRLGKTSILVGPNNCGKSTIIGAFRALSIAIRRARARKPEQINNQTSMRRLGYRLAEESLPISLENVHTDYEESETKIEFRLSNGNTLELNFWDKSAYLFATFKDGSTPRTAAKFRAGFPIEVIVVPVLGPVEHRESLVKIETVRAGLSTHRASRHFRNYWHHYSDQFEQFAELVASTWPGMAVERPSRNITSEGAELTMFCLENRIPRELYWAGFGFQIWCQLLTHAVRAVDCALFVVDEPEIYLHPDLQRQLLSTLRSLDPAILLATHSSEIMADAEPAEIMLVDKTQRSAKRLSDVEGVQQALDTIGSIQNITLTGLARNRKVLFVEGEKDFRLIRRFARRHGLMDLASGLEFTVLESGGFSSWRRIIDLSVNIGRTLGAALKIGAIYDSDFFPREQLDEVKTSLDASVTFGHIHERKEIENYLLVPSVLQRVVERTLSARAARRNETAPTVCVSRMLLEITDSLKTEVLGQLVGKRIDYLRKTKIDTATAAIDAGNFLESRWTTLDVRLSLVSGKTVLKKLREELASTCSITVTDAMIIDGMNRAEIPSDLILCLDGLEKFRAE